MPAPYISGDNTEFTPITTGLALYLSLIHISEPTRP